MSHRNRDDSRSNSVFKWLVKQFSAADDDLDSLGSEKGLEAFITRLPLTLPASTVEALSEKFENARALELTSEQLRRALIRLDERAQEPLAALGLSLFEGELGRHLSDTAWLTLTRFHRNVHTGYRVWMEGLPAHNERSNSERSGALLIASRAMAALSRYKALLRMRYRDVDAKFWGYTMELASWSASSGSSGTLIELYPRTGYQTSFEREFLIALLFEAAPFANLLPAQMAALDLILRRFAANYQFSDSYCDSTPFVIDLDREIVARRWLKGLSPRPGLRFFGVASAYAKLAGLHKQATASREIPDWLAPARLDVESYRALLDLLVSHWSVEPPQRHHRRARAEGEVLVTHGVGPVRRMIVASEYAKAGGRLSDEDNTPYDFKLFPEPQFSTVAEKAQESELQELLPMQTPQKSELEGDRQLTESWTISDVSDTGLGALVHAHDGWARIGMLIGFCRKDSLECEMAVVRRLSRSSRGTLSVGMTTIPATAYCAQLRIPANDDGDYWVPIAGTTDVHHDAILLRDGESMSLLLEPGVFTGEMECMISFEKCWHPVKLERSLERGYDYEQVAVTIFSEQTTT